MNSFFERKQEYFDRLYENPKLIQSILGNEKKKDNLKSRVFANPNTENELIFANSFFVYLKDVNHMMTARKTFSGTRSNLSL